MVDGRREGRSLKQKDTLLITGHTHQPAWLPPDPAKGRPYGQLVAGGPKATAATYVRGHATRDRFVVTHHKLTTGEALHQFDVGGAGG